jgi:hypothetical protein
VGRVYGVDDVDGIVYGVDMTKSTRTGKVTAQRCDGTVTLANGRKWGAYRFPTGEVYACPMNPKGYAVVECDAKLAATYRRAS